MSLSKYTIKILPHPTRVMCGKQIATLDTYFIMTDSRNTLHYFVMYVVSWTKRPKRYRVNHKQCRENRGVVGSINVSSVPQLNSFIEKVYVTLATSACGTDAWWV